MYQESRKIYPCNIVFLSPFQYLADIGKNEYWNVPSLALVCVVHIWINANDNMLELCLISAVESGLLVSTLVLCFEWAFSGRKPSLATVQCTCTGLNVWCRLGYQCFEDRILLIYVYSKRRNNCFIVVAMPGKNNLIGSPFKFSQLEYCTIHR